MSTSVGEGPHADCLRPTPSHNEAKSNGLNYFILVNAPRADPVM